MNRAGSRPAAGRGVAESAERAQDRASVLPALLAGLAESAVLYLPLHDVATNEGHVVAGPMAHYTLFVPVFAGAVAAATRWRGSRLLPAVGAFAIGVGVIQGFLWGTGDAVAATASVVLWLLVALRVFTLALRDWGDPISRSFGVGAGVLLAEIVFMGEFGEARSVLSVAVPQFLLASLASRAASLRSSTRAVTVARSGPEVGGRSPAGGRRPVGMALAAIVAFALLMGAAILLGGREGGLVMLSRAILAVVIPVLAYVLAPVAGFLVGALAWLFSLLNIDLTPLRSIGETLDNFRARPPDATGPGGGPVGRVLALMVLLGIGFLLVRTIRAQWQGFDRKGGPEEEPPTATPVSLFSSRRRRKRSQPGPELPADTVRRWYAEALLVLERLGLPKPPARTPGEYLRQVTVAFPECAPGFTALTRAYEDVRYGSLRFDPETLGRIEANQRLAMTALGRADKLEPEEDGNDRS
jgi:uncharacterized protein DUF4129